MIFQGGADPLPPPPPPLDLPLHITNIFSYVWSGMMSLEMKSLASSDILWNSSALKSHFPSVIFAIVSVSLLPRNGDKPESLLEEINERYIYYN